eukprot:UN21571
MDFKHFFQFASNTSRWLLVTPNGFLRTKSIFGIENAFFKLEALQSLRKTHFQSKFR